MEVEWQSAASGEGAVKAWVKDDVILLETAKHSLIAIRRADGVHLWRCDLEEALRFAPCVSRKYTDRAQELYRSIAQAHSTRSLRNKAGPRRVIRPRRSVSPD